MSSNPDDTIANHLAHEAECRSAATAYLKEKQSNRKYKVAASAPSAPACPCAECGRPTRLHFKADIPGNASVALCLKHAPAWAQDISC
jgi:hypothetical protein